MRIGLVGLAQSGKKTLFQLLTGAKAPASHGKSEFPVGVASVPDDRVDRLSALYKPKKTKHAEIELTLFPAMPHDAKARDKWFDAARQLDGMCFLVRAFSDPGVYHEEGSVDPARDLEKLDLEFTFADLALTETRLERLAKEKVKKTAAERGKQQELLGRFKAELEAGRWLRGLDLNDGDRARLTGLKFLTRIGTMIAVNVDEDVPSDAEKKRSLVVSLPARERRTVCVSAKFEAELAEIEDAAEREEFMSQFGVTESAAARLTRALLEALDQASFLTVGPDEVRAWLVRRGTTAPEAAGVVHSDFERGFIRAEVMDVDELLAAGSESKLKEQGKVALKGRDYVVRDGDIFHVLAGT